MDFGKLKNIDKVDFSMPDQEANNRAILKDYSKASHPAIYVGATGWSMPAWKGKWYSPKANSKSFLREYSRLFNTIELNTTHYRIPNKETIQRWYEESEADFRFCPKVPQRISHSSHLGLDDDALGGFSDAVLGLGEKLAPCFMQLPPHFDKDRYDILANFVKSWSRVIPLAIEVRHESWFEGEHSLTPLVELLQEYDMSLVITDVAGRRDVLHQRLSNAKVLVRFVGNGLHASDYTRIDAWVNQLLQWLEMGLKEIYFFTHEPDNILAPDLAAYLVEQLSKQNLPVRGPTPYRPDAEQLSLF